MAVLPLLITTLYIMLPYFSFTVIQLGPITFQVWGLTAALGFLLALFISLKEAEKKNIAEDDIWNIMILALINLVAGSKIFYLISNSGLSVDPEEIFNLAGGFSLLGGIISALAAGYIYAKFKKISVCKLADVLTPGAIVAITTVRLGCFLVYDHVGKITNLPWGMAYIDGSIRHPVSLYLAANGIMAFILILYLKRKKLNDGILFLAFALYYSITRFIFDFARCNDLDLCDARYMELSATQFILLFSVPVLLLLFFKRRKKKDVV